MDRPIKTLKASTRCLLPEPARDLTQIARFAGIPGTTILSAKLAARYHVPLTFDPAARADLKDLVWMVGQVIAGIAPSRSVPTWVGMVRVVEFSTFIDGAKEAVGMVVAVLRVPCEFCEPVFWLLTVEEIEVARELRVLLADGHPELGNVLKLLLESQGFTVTVVASGTEALRLAPLLRPDIVLLDAVLPPTDGLEVWRRIKGDPLTAEAAVFVLTGHSDIRVRAAEAGATAFLRKPEDIPCLAHFLRRLKPAPRR